MLRYRREERKRERGTERDSEIIKNMMPS